EQRGGQRDEHEHAEGSDFGDGQGDERQEVGEPGDGLRAVFQGVDDHAGGEGVVDNLGGGNGVHGVNGGVERGPSAADQAVGEGAVFFPALEDDAGEEHDEGGAQAEGNAPGGAELRVGVVEQQRDADDGDEDADFV